jgi:hypothetical protein
VLNLIKKKYFVLTAILLVGVVLLSGCMGGENLIDDNNEVDEIVEEVNEKSTIESAIADLNKKDSTEADKHFSDSFVYEEFTGQWDEISLVDFLKRFTLDKHDNISIEEFTKIENNTYKLILRIDTTTEKTRYLHSIIQFKKSDDKFHISNLKDIKPEEEISLLNSVASSIETNGGGKEEFVSCFSNEAELYFEDDPVESPSAMYDRLVPDNTVTMKNSNVKIEDIYYPEANKICFEGVLSIEVEKYTEPQKLHFIATIDTNTSKIIELR